MKNLASPAIFVLAIFLLQLPVQAATLFVAQEASGSGDGSSYGNRAAYTHHNNGQGSFSNLEGDTVVLCGSFNDPSFIQPPDSGTPGNEILYTGRCSVYGGQDAVLNSSHWNGNIVVYQSNIVFHWLDVSSTANSSVGINFLLGADSCQVKNCFFHDLETGVNIMEAVGITVGGSPEYSNLFSDLYAQESGGDIVLQGTDSKHVEGTLISYNELSGDKTSTGSNGIVVNEGSQTTEDTDPDVQGMLVEHNYIHGHQTGNELGFRGGRNLTVRKNIFSGSNSATTQGSIAGLGYGVFNAYLYGNFISDGMRSGISVSDGLAGGALTHDIFVWSNIIQGTNHNAIHLQGDGDGFYNSYVWNNNLVDNCQDPLDQHAGLQVQSNIDGVNIIKNNILQDNRHLGPATKTRQMYVNDATSLEIDHNSYHSLDGPVSIWYRGTSQDLDFPVWQGYGYDLNGQESRISFIDQSGKDFRTSSNPSPADSSVRSYHDDADKGLDEDSMTDPLPCGQTPGGTAFCASGLILSDRDDFNSGTWGKGAFVFNSSEGSSCIPDGCNENCPQGCSLNQDPDCFGNGCCGDGTCDPEEAPLTCPGDCPLQACSDGTPYDTCSSTQPLFCLDGSLDESCSSCGCHDGTCQPDGSCLLNCVENWTCTGWSDCSAGTQTRECSDQNSCGTQDDKPSESQSCDMPVYHAADTSQNCAIEQYEVVSYVDLWHSDSTTNPMHTLMEAIAFWKSGGNSCS